MHAAIDSVIRDTARLDELVRLRLLDTPPEEPFDRLTRLAVRTLNAPVALVSLVDDHRQFFKSSSGLPEPWCSRRETPLSHSFCQHVVSSAAPLVIDDARLNPLVSGNPAVSELSVIAYLGVPLITPTGKTIGSFCVIAPRPVAWTQSDMNALRDLAASVMSEIALRCAHDDLLSVNAELLRQAAAREEAIVRLTDSEARLRAAQCLAHVGSFELHATPQRHGTWSEEARRIMALGEHDAPSTVAGFVARVVYPEDRDRVARAMQLSIDQQLITQIEYRTELPCGGTRTLVTAVEPLPKGAGGAAVVCTAFDVTQQREAEAAAAEQRSQLLHVARVATAGEMAAVMAHEINQPLAAISHTANACERLLRSGRLDNAALLDHLGVMAHQAKRASEIIRRIGSFVRKQPFLEKPVDLDRVLSDVKMLLAPLVWRNGIQLSRGRRLADAHVMGDEIQLVQLVANIVRNAIDAVSGNPVDQRHVAIGIERQNQTRLVLCVSDNGPGISEELREKVFEPFFTTRDNGLGMGLAISRTIAECHGATLSVGVPRGAERGTEFRVTFGADQATTR